MANRKIKCESSLQYLGEIRDARIKKGLVYLCGDCDKKRKNALSYMIKAMKKTKTPDMPDFFKGIFN